MKHPKKQVTTLLHRIFGIKSTAYYLTQLLDQCAVDFRLRHFQIIGRVFRHFLDRFPDLELV
jgi:hypothetical protein